MLPIRRGRAGQTYRQTSWMRMVGVEMDGEKNKKQRLNN